jgi:cytochrome c
MKKLLIMSSLLAGLFASAFSTSALAFDEEAAKELMKQNKCSQCHALKDKEKDAPPFNKISAKFKGKADAEEKLIKHLTTSPKVKLSDGSEEEHKVLKTTPAKDIPQVKNAIQFILSQ